MRSASVLALVVLCAGPAQLLARTEKEKTSLETWLEEHGFSLRKAFDGSKSEEKAASVSVVESGSGEGFYNVDLALKLADWVPVEGRNVVSIYPTVEWHRSSSADKPVNKKSAALSLEWYTGPVQIYDVRGNRRLDLEEPGARAIVPQVVTKAEVTRDSQANKTTSSFSMLATAFGTKPGFPGSVARGRFGFVRFYPYVGVEYFDNLPIERDGSVLSDGFSDWFALGRLFVDWRPQAWLAFQLEYTYRESLGDDFDGLKLFVGSASFFLDAKRRFALTYEFEDGETPKQNFQRARTSTISLTAKYP